MAKVIRENSSFSPGADLGFFTHQSNAEGVSHARGVRGHAPPGKFINLDSLKCDFQHFPSNILKIVKHEFYLSKHPFPALGEHLFSDLSELYVYMLYIE